LKERGRYKKEGLRPSYTPLFLFKLLTRWGQVANLWTSKMMKDLIFYAVAANVIALIAYVAGASLTVILFSSLLIPPLLLLIIRIIR
jgi:hypothetical protein